MKIIFYRLFVLFLLVLGTLPAIAVNKIDGIYYNLDSFYKSCSVTSGNIKYSGEVVIPSEITYNGDIYDVTSIGSSAFYGCTGLTSITIPNSVTSIGIIAFEDCTGLKNIEIPNSVTSIGESMFYGCTGLTSITIPNSVTEVGNKAFFGCTGLKNIEIPNSVTSIGDRAFEDCTGLTTVTIKDGTSTLKMGYNSYSINHAPDPGEDFITAEVLFHDCPLKTVYLGRNLSYDIKGRNLSYDINISSYYFTLYDYSPFRGQSTLTSVTIGKSVDEVGEKAFYDCTGLTSVTCYAEEPPTAGDYCFDNLPDDAVLYVPTGTTEKYKSANQWSRFFKIEEVDPNTAIRDVRIDQQSGPTTIFDLYGHKLAQPRRGVNIINGKKVLVK